jgi:hypothetical protein
MNVAVENYRARLIRQTVVHANRGYRGAAASWLAEAAHQRSIGDAEGGKIALRMARTIRETRFF